MSKNQELHCCYCGSPAKRVGGHLIFECGRVDCIIDVNNYNDTVTK